MARTPPNPRAQWTVAVLVAALLVSSPHAWAQRRRAAGGVHENRVVDVLHGIERTWRSGRYDHATRIDPTAGHYAFDCSVMVAWVLRRAAPAAAREVEAAAQSTRPLARHYQRHLAAPPARSAWRAIPRVADARPGDVIAWNFPTWIRTHMTGHAAFVMEPPRAYPGRPHTFVLRIADSSSVPHDRDTRERGRFRGFGYGDIYVQVDPVRGTPVAYRPNLRPGTGFLRTTISLARPLR
ncbi:MAG: hypothetical protein U0325_02615 [Polyangiales bacterium]